MADQVVRVRGYVESLSKALEEARSKTRQSREVQEVLKLSELYLEDAKYYLSLGDYVTAVACVAYAEGLLDSLRILGLTEFTWRKPEVRKVLAAGSFDLVHPGHIYFLSEAQRLGLLYVVVARDTSIQQIKGRPPVLNEVDRLTLVSSLKPVYRALLGDSHDFLRPVVEVKPDVIVLGPDQPFDEEELRRKLESRGLPGVEVIRLRYRLNNYSSTNIIKRVAEIAGKLNKT
ncbi:MAG: cytidylyltransferase family protein [Desulfurococcaceae archaeon]|nr:cytidylyltransferase family protein [Desulfurococcaceae archaeon]